jgi:hypothetical protein
VTERLGIDDQADVMGADIAQRLDHAGAPRHAHFDDKRDERLEVTSEGDAAADRDVGVALAVARRGSRIPAIFLGRHAHRFAVARMREIAQAEFHRIARRRRGDLVDEGFAAEQDRRAVRIA